MCGRFTLISDADEFAEEFGVYFREVGPYLSRFNIAPTQNTLVLCDAAQFRDQEPHPANRSQSIPDSPFACLPMRWGLVPSWAKDVSIGARMINARSETVAEKPSFRAAFRRRRCLVPASGFYEWQKPQPSDKKSPKIPHYIRSNSSNLLTFAGLWEEWTSNDGEIVVSFTILTTTPNAVMKPLHDRMPVIVDRTDRACWVMSDDPEEIATLLQPYDDNALTAFAVSTLVNNARNEDPACIQPV